MVMKMCSLTLEALILWLGNMSAIVKLSAGDVPMVPIGLWGDGVPCNWDRTESVEVVSMNLPGQDGQWGPLRIPLVAISKKDVGPNTMDDLMGVIAWSLRYLAAGFWPSSRHDGSALDGNA